MTEDYINVYSGYAIKLLRLQNELIQTFDRYRRGNKQTVEVRLRGAGSGRDHKSNRRSRRGCARMRHGTHASGRHRTIWPKPGGVGREREPVTPVGRQQLLVGHGAVCMVGQEARAGPRATATAISSMGSGPARAWTCAGPCEPRFGRSGACFERSVPGDRECGRIGLRCGIAPPGSRKNGAPHSEFMRPVPPTFSPTGIL